MSCRDKTPRSIASGCDSSRAGGRARARERSRLDQILFQEGGRITREVGSMREAWEQAMCGTRTTAPRSASLKRTRGPLPRRSSRLHAYYPLLLHTAFPGVPGQTAEALSRADRLFTEHLLIHDRCLDRPSRRDPLSWFVANLQQHQSLLHLHRLFSQGHAFWKLFERLQLETWRAVRIERLFHRHALRPFPRRRFFALARGKTAALKAFCLALPFLAERMARLETISRSLDQHHIGLVLLDDLEDWKQDFATGNFTFLLSRVAFGNGLAHSIRGGESVSLERFGRNLFAGKHVEHQLCLAEGCFQRSIRCVAGERLPDWEAFNLGFVARCRALRRDLTEILRRETVRIRRVEERRVPGVSASCGDPTLQAIRAGVSYLGRVQGADGGFPLERSPHLYMAPARRLEASRPVTVLLRRALAPLEDLDARIPALLRECDRWLAQPADTPPHASLATQFEASFRPMATTPTGILQRDASFSPTHRPLQDGLSWAHLLLTARDQGVNPPRLLSFVQHCLDTGRLGAWSGGVSPGALHAPWQRGARLPLLPLLLLLLGVGRAVSEGPLLTSLREAVQDARAICPTDCALLLLCLLVAGHQGMEIAACLRRITETQAEDGSWPPNAIHWEKGAHYGSRALTTAWCVLAILLAHLRCPRPPATVSTGPSAAPDAPCPRIHLHRRIPDRLRPRLERLLERLEGHLPRLPHTRLHLGRWPSLPPHFVVARADRSLIGLNLGAATASEGVCGPWPETRLEREAVRAVALALRLRACGPLREPIEHIWLVGAGLWLCGSLWPETPVRVHAGLAISAWRACAEQEGRIWSELVRCLGTRLPPSARVQTLRPSCGCPPGVRLPEGAPLYIGARLFQAARSQSITPDLARDIRLPPRALHVRVRQLGVS